MDTNTLLQDVEHKLGKEAERIGSAIPYIAENGRYEDMGKEDICWWTNGFWPGILWLLSHDTKDRKYARLAKKTEGRLDDALSSFLGLHHDVGFMWLLSSVASYRLTGDMRSYERALHAATILAGRYNPLSRSIRSWNDGYDGYVIIDSLMNINLLYWASEVTGDPRFKAIAMTHADTILAHHLQEDGHVVHIVDFDPNDGSVRSIPVGQGYASGSAWSRGQSWGIYGFALSYRHTGEERYLLASRRIADYYLSHIREYGYVPPVDFLSPKEPAFDDTTSGTCAACGLLELAEHLKGKEGGTYREGARRIIEACVGKWGDFDAETDGILGGGSGSWHGEKHHEKIIYGDYFLLEALLRLEGKSYLLW